MQRRSVGRGRAARVRAGSAVRVSGAGNCVPAGRIRLSLPNPYSYET